MTTNGSSSTEWLLNRFLGAQQRKHNCSWSGNDKTAPPSSDHAIDCCRDSFGNEDGVGGVALSTRQRALVARRPVQRNRSTTVWMASGCSRPRVKNEEKSFYSILFISTELCSFYNLLLLCRMLLSKRLTSSLESCMQCSFLGKTVQERI